MIVFSYNVDNYWRAELDKISGDYGIAVFMPVNNDSIVDSGFQNNVFHIGGGSVENVQRRSPILFGYTTAENRPTSQKNTTSWTNGAAAGWYSHFIELGLSVEQTKKAFIQAISNYPTKTVQNGYGKIPEVASVPESYDFRRPNFLWVYVGSQFPSEKRVVQVYFANWEPQTVEGNRIYINDELVFEGLGTLVQDAGWTGASNLRRVNIDLFENGVYEFKITAFNGEVETDPDAFTTASIEVILVTAPEPAPPTPDPDPQPEPEPEPELNPEPSPAIPPPIIEATKEGSIVTLTQDIDVFEILWYRNAGQGFEFIGEAEQLTDTVNPLLSYAYCAVWRDGEILSEPSNIAYIAKEFLFNRSQPIAAL